MQFKIRDARPIWQQLTEQLTERIVTGYYPPGSRFPTVRELASEAGVNPNTMQRSMAQLEADGLVTTNRTVGRTVTEDETVLGDKRLKMAAERAHAFLTDLKDLGFDAVQAKELLEREGEEIWPSSL